MLALGFSAGLPLLLVLGTLSFLLREAGIDRQHHRLPELGGPGLWLQVGVGAAGGPVCPSGAHALLGRRRSWLLLAQLPWWWPGWWAWPTWP